MTPVRPGAGLRGGIGAGGHRARLGLVFALLAVLAGCDHKAPAAIGDDQVMASVPDAEITRFELRNEPAAIGELPTGVLERVIDRKLLAARARSEQVEDDPEYLAALRRTREELLIAALRRKLAREGGQPDEAQLRAFAAEHPWMFARRQVLVLEDGSGLAQRTLDTAALDLAQWQALAPYSGRIVLNGQSFRIASVTLVPVDPVHDREVAVRLWQRDRIERDLQGTIEAARRSGAVRYPPGRGPAAR
ncbi:MAG TPA: hypothetical protein VI199_08980 [Novosphingobium sp.]